MSKQKEFNARAIQRRWSRAIMFTIFAASLTLITLTIAAVRIPSGEQAKASAKLTDSAYRFIPGERRIYKLSYESQSEYDFRRLLQSRHYPEGRETNERSSLARSFKTSLSAELIVTVVARNADNSLLAYSLRDPKVRLLYDGQESENERIKTGLLRNIFAEVNSQGRVISVRFDTDVNGLPHSLIRAVLSITQFVFPNDPLSQLQQWEVQEDDPNGQYVARYQAVSEPAKDAERSKKTFRKNKTHYLQPAHSLKPGDLKLRTQINPKGEMIARFDFIGGYLASLEGEESQAFVTAEKNVANTAVAFRMDHLRKETLTAAELGRLREASAAREKLTPAVPLSVTRSKEESKAAIHRSELGTATLGDLLAELARAEVLNDLAHETKLLLKFEALVYLHPETSAMLGEILANSEASSLSIRVLASALGNAGHDDAQRALVAAIRTHSEPWPALSILIPTLGSVNAPNQLSEDTLRDLASNQDGNIASMAQLALGIIARNLATSSPDRAAKIVDWATEQLGSSPSSDIARQWLLVLGNAGSARALPVISRYITDSSPEFRATAASALRFMKSSQADELLVKALVSDSDAAVRLEAVVALGFREMNSRSLYAQKTVFMQDKTVSVRLALLKNLWQMHEAFPEIRNLVKQAAAKDRSKEVRKEASEIMMRNEDYFQLRKGR